jgi:hypothetical protein
MIDMGQRAVIRFFAFKGLKVTAIHTELELVYYPAALTRPTVKKWRGRFHQRRTDLFDDPDHAGAIVLCLKKGRSGKVFYRHVRIGKATSLRIFHNRLGLAEFHFRWVPHVLLINQKSERVSYSKLLLTTQMKQKRAAFNELSPGMSCGSSSITSVIRSGWHRVMSFLNLSSRKLTWKSAWF